MVTNSGYLIQGEMHADDHMPHGPGNFELVVPSERGGLVHCWRNNSVPDLPWFQEAFFGSGWFDRASVIQRSDLHGPGDLEAIARAGDRLAHFRRENGKWKEPLYIGSGISGAPALIQSRFGRMGNYEVVAPVAQGGLAYYRRQNDDPARPWTSPVFFASGIGEIEGVTLLQSNFGDPGNLEIVATVRQGSERQLVHFWSDPSTGPNWHGPGGVPLEGLPAGVQPTGAPTMVQGSHGERGDFELVVPLTNGMAAHLARQNDRPDLAWTAVRLFGSGDITEASIIQGVFGNLELVARTGSRYTHFWYQREAETWHGPGAVAWEEPAVDPAQKGIWQIPYSCSVVGIHAALLHTGRVLFFAYLAEADQGLGLTSVLDPVTGRETVLPVLAKDPFCGGHAFTPDGSFLVAGGSGGGLTGLQTFEPDADAGQWHQLPDLAVARWYPTCAALPDGQILIISGTKEGGTQPAVPLNDTYQIYSPNGLLSDPVQVGFLNDLSPVSIYPFVFLLPSGLLFLHGWNKTRFLDLAASAVGDAELLTIRSEPRNYPVQGSAVLLPLLPDSAPPYRARIMLIGGGGVPPATAMPATETCEILDLGANSPRWEQAPPMSSRRVMPDAVLLPDGTVLVVNGSAAGWAHDANQPVYETEAYNPSTGQWTALCPRRVPRLYHSSALLLPDGRVLTAGSDEAYNIEPFHKHELRIEIFSPPYLFRGPRPVFAVSPGAVPDQVQYGAAFAVATPDAASIASAALLRPGASTHSLNMEQRHIGLRIRSRGAGTLTLGAPPDGRIAPPGYYMLFLLNQAGVPSEARFVRLAA